MAPIVERTAFFVTVISSGYAAARGVSKHSLVLGQTQNSPASCFISLTRSAVIAPRAEYTKSLERATAVREEVRHNCTAILLLLFVIRIVAALEALCQVRVKMCKPLEQTQPPGPAI